MKCKDCGAKISDGMFQCPNPKCRAINIGSSGFDLTQHVVRLSEVRGKTERLPRYKTGLVDDVFGGGIVQTSVVLLGGEPGAGKTTLCLQLCDEISNQTGRDSLYIANEQSDIELEETSRRLQLRRPELVCIVKAMGGVTFPIADVLVQFKPCFLVLDSLTKWSGEDLQLAVTISQQLKDLAVLLKCPVIAINQVNKSDDHAGLKQLQHAVDMCAMFDILIGELDENGKPLPAKLAPRRLMSTKNRFGPAPEEQYFSMTETGLVPVTLQPLD